MGVLGNLVSGASNPLGVAGIAGGADYATGASPEESIGTVREWAMPDEYLLANMYRSLSPRHLISASDAFDDVITASKPLTPYASAAAMMLPEIPTVLKTAARFIGGRAIPPLAFLIPSELSADDGDEANPFKRYDTAKDAISAREYQRATPLAQKYGPTLKLIDLIDQRIGKELDPYAEDIATMVMSDPERRVDYGSAKYNNAADRIIGRPVVPLSEEWTR